MDAVYEVLQQRGVGFDAEKGERGVVVEEDLVGAMAQQLLGRGLGVGAEDDGVHGVVDLRGELARLAEQFERDRVERAVLDFRDDGDAAPERLVDAGGGVVHELEDVAVLAHALAAHAAARADGEVAA